MRADLGTGVDSAAVEPHSGATGRSIRGDLPDVGPEPVGRVLGGDPALQCCAAHLDGVLAEAQVGEGLARSDAELGLHQVDVGNLLGDRVLHLDPGIHLDKDVLARPLTDRVDEELDSARVDVAKSGSESHSVPVQRLPDIFIKVRSWGYLDDFLVAALNGAVTLEQVHHVALRVGENLHLDVAGPEHRLLQEHGRITEGGVRFTHGSLERLPECLRLVHPTHSSSATAGNGFGENGKADVLRCGDQLVEVSAGLGGLQHRDAGLAGGLQCVHLVPGKLKYIGWRSNERDTCFFGGPGKPWVF